MIDCNVTEIVGRVEGGVKCISPSPDGDLLAVTSGLGQLLVMTQDWDVLYETAFEDHPEDVDVSESINSLSNSRGNPISWRGDGRYFATFSKMQNLRKIQVWERDSGLLHSSSDPKPFNSETLDWMPSGAKIATVYDRRDENMCPSIAFFERNGLERSSFSINEPSDAAVEVLKWNCSSDLLSVLVGCGRYYSLKIWSFSNNHWYLKQVIKYSRQERLQVMWDPTKPLQLICWTSTGQISVYNFVWITAVMDNSVALVIDDSSILVTPLSLTLIPPPMYLFKLKFPSAVREMAFHSNNSKNQLAAYLSDGSLCFVELPALSFWEDLEGKEFAIEASVCDIAFGSFLHLEWLDSHILLGASHVGFHYERCLSQAALKNNKHLGYHLIEIMALCSENHVPDSVTCSSWNVKVSNQISVEKLVISIASNPAKKGSAFVQFNGGDVFEYVSQASMPQSASAPYFEKFNGVVFSSSCPWVTVAYVNSGAQLKPLSFGLNEHGVLHVDERILCNNCSSFSVYSNSSDQIVTHLILATKQDLLYVVDISDVLDGHAPVKYENFMHIASKRREEDCRNFINIWERGAKITGVLHGDEAAVILQTIRGNLECICPRKLVLTSIINALVQKRFKDALLMVRRHRIDFNIVVDFCGWQAFLPLASDFVSQVNNLSYITEFVCALKNENTSLKLYRNHISFPSANVNDMPTGHLESSDPRSKVSGVLLAIRKALEEQIPESPARELCILTTLARNDPPALEEALARIKVTREMELSGSSDQRRTSYPSAEEALKHLLWLSDADAVFQAALGLYDLNLAAIVALNAQRDPKEFLPFLQELERLPTLLMQYRIDLHLKRYEKALKHIVCAGEAYHSDCMDLLKDQPQLFPLGLHLFTDPLKRNQIYEAWGDHLVNEKSFEEAATTFLCCFCLEKALKSYHACGHWSGVLTVAGLLKLDKEEVLKLAQELCEELQALGKPGEAAKIALEYCGDVNFAISLLISAREWEEALRIAFMHRNDNLITEVKNASTECAGILISEYEEGLEKIGKYLTRYLAVRQRRLLLAAKLRSEEHSVNEVDDDTISEASSNFSGMSAYTTGYVEICHVNLTILLC
ncbi:Elongator complex protein 1 [Bienertia sinuspersici]